MAFSLSKNEISFPCMHSHLSLFFYDLGIIKAPILEAGSDAWRCEGSAGVDI